MILQYLSRLRGIINLGRRPNAQDELTAVSQLFALSGGAAPPSSNWQKVYDMIDRGGVITIQYAVIVICIKANIQIFTQHNGLAAVDLIVGAIPKKFDNN